MYFTPFVEKALSLMINLDVFYSIKDPFNRSNNVNRIITIGNYLIVLSIVFCTISFLMFV
jgi:hypothetical protein